MNSSKLIYLLPVLFLHGLSVQAQIPLERITFGTLLEEQTNREANTQVMSSSWTQHQASSYERLSVSPEDPEGWFANHDWNHFEAKEIISGRTEFVMLDVDGPGVITRFWNGGNPSLKAALRFYVDDDTIPAWEADHSGALIGENKLVGYPLSALSVSKDQPLDRESSKLGHNLYAPIPFSKHILITYEGPDPRPGAGKGMFYNINYRLYRQKVEMESLNKGTTIKYGDVLSRTSEKLERFIDKTPKEVKMPEEKQVMSKSFRLDNSESGSVKVKGRSSIRRLLLTFERDSLAHMVKDLFIKISFDGRKTVDIPIGFLFGCGDQLVAVSDWYKKVDTLGNMSCFWVMPFQHEADVTLLNKGDNSVRVNLEVATGDCEWDENTLYFHANYSELKNYQTEARKGQDFNMISITGSGNYVGDVLQISKPVGGWWGEGDEKIYIDGSKFPDHFGTGTEDYYGYAWGGQYPNPFIHPFIGQPIGKANDKKRGGTTVNSRVRALDAIPFNKSLRFDMESWNWHGGEVDFSWACFWYAGLDVVSY